MTKSRCRDDNDQHDGLQEVVAIAQDLWRAGPMFSSGHWPTCLQLAEDWLDYGFCPVSASAWIDAGVWCAGTASALADAGVGIRAMQWLAREVDAELGIDSVYSLCNGDFDIDRFIEWPTREGNEG